MVRTVTCHHCSESTGFRSHIRILYVTLVCFFSGFLSLPLPLSCKIALVWKLFPTQLTSEPIHQSFHLVHRLCYMHILLSSCSLACLPLLLILVNCLTGLFIFVRWKEPSNDNHRRRENVCGICHQAKLSANSHLLPACCAALVHHNLAMTFAQDGQKIMGLCWKGWTAAGEGCACTLRGWHWQVRPVFLLFLCLPGFLLWCLSACGFSPTHHGFFIFFYRLFFFCPSLTLPSGTIFPPWGRWWGTVFTCLAGRHTC